MADLAGRGYNGFQVNVVHGIPKLPWFFYYTHCVMNMGKGAWMKMQRQIRYFIPNNNLSPSYSHDCIRIAWCNQTWTYTEVTFCGRMMQPNHRPVPEYANIQTGKTNLFFGIPLWHFKPTFVLGKEFGKLFMFNMKKWWFLLLPTFAFNNAPVRNITSAIQR